MATPHISRPRSVQLLKIGFLIFFWAFNASLLLIAYLGLLPFLGTPLIADALAGQVPWDFFLPFVGLVGVPTTCSIVSVLPKQRRSVSLAELFFGVEAPLLLLCLARFFWLRDLTPGTTLLLATGFLGIVTFSHWLLHQRALSLMPQEAGSLPGGPTSLLTWNSVHLVGLSLGLLLALYATALIAFYVLPFTLLAVVGLPMMLIYSAIALPFVLLLAGLFSAPIGTAWLYFLTLRQLWRQGEPSRRTGFTALLIGVLAGWVALFFTLHRSPHLEAFEWLSTPATTPQARQERLQKQDAIRQGLVDAYLAPYRYPRAADRDRHIFDLYRYSLSTPEPLAQVLQDAYDRLLSPFTYPGDPQADAEKASALYSQFFDTPILRGEKAAIENALESTFNRTEAKAGLDDINAQRVWLAEQQLTVKPQGDWAEVELYEVYENQTFDQQEVLYYFSMPESAVMTGLWLGETANRSTSFPYVIAPRGAAQQVYNQEVNRRQDPALLEQVGPRQYRLRAFPIPPNRGRMHLWMTYKVLQQEQGWALPELIERRNLYWTNTTQRQVNGQSIAAVDQWLPAAPKALPAKPTSHQISLPWGAHILAQPFTGDYQLPQGKRFAIVLDGSYSMNAHRTALKSSFRWLEQNLLNRNSADLYLTTAQPALPGRIDNLKQFDPQAIPFYGTLQPSEMLQQFEQLQGETAYDAILLLTDPGSYELSADRPQPLSLSAPLWLVHLGGLQLAYDDATQQAIQDSGGGVATQIEEVAQRLGTTPTLGDGTTRLNVVDGYAWYVTQQPTDTAQPSEGFEPLAARQWVTHLSRYVQPTQLKELDTIHAVTKEYRIVSPYSSMLVLVNDQQRQALKQAEQAQDRFKREVEDQQLPQPSGIASVTATPEPAEWMLLLVTLGLMGWVYQRRFTLTDHI